MNSLITFAPGREGIDIGITIPPNRAAVCLGRFPDIGVLSPRRVAAATRFAFRSSARGNSSHDWTLAGLVCRFPRGGRPALFLRAFQSSNGVNQGGARSVGREPLVHAGLLWSAAKSAAGAAACHGAGAGRGAP